MSGRRKSFWSKTRRVLRRFCTAQAGVAAIEFAYVVPVLVVLMAGTIEASRAVNMNRKFSLVTSMTGDLVARESDLGSNASGTLDTIMGIIDHVMEPYDSGVLRLAVIPVMADPADATNTFVYAPPYSHNGKEVPAKCSPYTLPNGLVAPGGSVIVVESDYSFSPIFADWLIGATVWEDRATNSPRSACVDFESNNCVVSC